MDYLERIRSAGHRLTKARQAVLTHLQDVKEPQTVAAVYEGLGKRVDLASVYRTVELLEALGLATREQQGKLGAYALVGNHHHHIVCRSCDTHACLPCNVSMRVPNGFSAVHHQVMLTGVCAACATR